MTGSDAAIERKNPFVGPRPIDLGQKIFGRDREIEQLYYFLSGERIVLLHSPSGAGKSSLIQAGLVPRLARLFDVWGPARVNLEPLENQDGQTNRYIRSANLSFEGGLPKERQRPPEMVSRMTLSGYFADRPRRRSAPQNVVLLFDQFEEILTVDPLGLPAKIEFFEQVGKLLQDSHVWAVFILREDYLALLDPYAEQVPTHLKNRFRLDLLEREPAAEAISKSVETSGREFQPDALDKLINDLATMQVQRPDGTFETKIGPYVEPLHLQVAGRGLWERMPAEKATIDLDDIQSFGNVTDALAEYYAKEMAGIASGDVRTERTLREWVDGKLIAPGGIRRQVLKGAGKSEGLDNTLIGRLVDSHLVRAEQRAGATWYELSHDRLMDPVKINNARWFEDHLHKIQKIAIAWESLGNPPSQLLLGLELKEALDWAEKQSELTPGEQKFFAASKAAQAAAIEKRQHTRRVNLLAVVLTLVLSLEVPGLTIVFALIAGVLGVREWPKNRSEIKWDFQKTSNLRLEQAMGATLASIALMLIIIASFAHKTENAAQLLRTKASVGWNRFNIVRMARDQLQQGASLVDVIGEFPHARYAAEIEKYKQQLDSIREQQNEFDYQVHSDDRRMFWIRFVQFLFEFATVLAATAILKLNRKIWIASIAGAVSGIGVAVYVWLMLRNSF